MTCASNGGEIASQIRTDDRADSETLQAIAQQREICLTLSPFDIARLKVHHSLIQKNIRQVKRHIQAVRASFNGELGIRPAVHGRTTNCKLTNFVTKTVDLGTHLHSIGKVELRDQDAGQSEWQQMLNQANAELENLHKELANVEALVKQLNSLNPSNQFKIN